MLENEHPQTTRWPDFYELLETAPEADPQTLRRQINLLYDRAQQNTDHRELKRRFYYQLLLQKVLPQCRRILLDSEARKAYDTQWQLHALGASDAISYQTFIKRMRQTHEKVVTGMSAIDEDEIALLPAVIASEDCMAAEIPTQIMPEESAAPAIFAQVSAAPAAVATPVATHNVANTASVVSTSAHQPNVLVSPNKNKRILPLALGALAVLMVGSWMFTRGRGAATGAGSDFSESSVSAADWKPVNGFILTDWAKKVKPTQVLPEYPRPQMVRKQWQNLNGLWSYALSASNAKSAPADKDGQILVPYPYESALSGVAKKSIPTQKLWYRRKFTIPSDWGKQRVVLHFGAVNWEAKVKVNDKILGVHRGGYDSFEFDITDALQPGDNALEVSVINPLDEKGGQIMGKQREKSEGIYYTASTGIWQTVWLEPVPEKSIKSLSIVPDIDDSTVEISALTNDGAASKVSVEVRDGGKTLAKVAGDSDKPIRVALKNPKLWTPNSPKLYDVRVSLMQNGAPADSVDSYFAMRKTSVQSDSRGVKRLMLNNRFVMQQGVLDQGYWPDGLYTAPTDDALKYDIEMTKKLGFNMCRKHAKVEPDRWYYHADQLGLLVWQDMPQGFVNDPSPEIAGQFKTELKGMVDQLKNHPSVIVWTTFNEGWGQHATQSIVDYTHQLDPSRPINEASGWTDTGNGDISDGHSYPLPSAPKPDGKRAVVNGEFGGIGLVETGHTWATDAKTNYGEARNSWDLTRQYRELMRKANGLRDNPGASAFVYTQLTDVEQETNGLLTYDRKKVKPILKIAAAAAQGHYLPLPPNPTPDILPTALNSVNQWFYSTGKPADNWMQPNFKTNGWKAGMAGFGTDVEAKANPKFKIRTPWSTSDIWMRREVVVPAKLPTKIDFICAHDESVEIYINGVLAASADKFTTDYVILPMTDVGRAALRPGKNIIAVHCNQTEGGQYIDVGMLVG